MKAYGDLSLTEGDHHFPTSSRMIEPEAGPISPCGGTKRALISATSIAHIQQAGWSSRSGDHSVLRASIGLIAKMRMVALQAATRAAAKSKIDAMTHVDIPGVLAPTKTC